jgi:hypothetical protein
MLKTGRLLIMKQENEFESDKEFQEKYAKPDIQKILNLGLEDFEKVVKVNKDGYFDLTLRDYR